MPQACGYVSEVDSRLKLNTFILKNPPENKLSKAEKKCVGVGSGCLERTGGPSRRCRRVCAAPAECHAHLAPLPHSHAQGQEAGERADEGHGHS